jgi:hypothetical protein
MTDSLKARIEELSKHNLQPAETIDSLYSALLAVLEIETWMETDIGTQKELGYRMGYNQALAAVRAKIEGAM